MMMEVQFLFQIVVFVIYLVFFMKHKKDYSFHCASDKKDVFDQSRFSLSLTLIAIGAKTGKRK